MVIGHPQRRHPRADLGPATQYVLDTGPMLCLGGFPMMLRLVKHRSHGKAHWVEAVRAEVVRHGLKAGPLGAAARTFQGNGANWLTPPAVFSDADNTDLDPVRARLEVLAREKAESRRSDSIARRDSRADLGEAQSILHAKRNGHTVLTNDDGANIVAGENNLSVATIVDLARQLVAERNSARELARGLMKLQADGIDTGEHIAGPLALIP